MPLSDEVPTAAPRIAVLICSADAETSTDWFTSPTDRVQSTVACWPTVIVMDECVCVAKPAWLQVTVYVPGGSSGNT